MLSNVAEQGVSEQCIWLARHIRWCNCKSTQWLLTRVTFAGWVPTLWLLYKSTLTSLDFCWKAHHLHAVQGDVCWHRPTAAVLDLLWDVSSVSAYVWSMNPCSHFRTHIWSGASWYFYGADARSFVFSCLLDLASCFVMHDSMYMFFIAWLS